MLLFKFTFLFLVQTTLANYLVMPFFKQNENNVNIYKHGDKGRRIVGVVPIHPKNNKVMLVTSRRKDGKWVLPKGGIKKHEDAFQAGLREVYEEAGLLGFALPDVYGPFNMKQSSKISFFPMMVMLELDDFPEKNQRERKWFEPELAYALVREETMKWAIANVTSLDFK